MLRDDAVALMQMLLGFRTDQAANIVTLMQTVQTELENGPIKPWFLFSEDSFALTLSGEERVPLPTDFLLEVDESPLRYRPSDFPTHDEIELWKDDYDLLKKNFAPSTILPGTQQVPQAYAIMGGYYRIFPTPDQSYTLRQIYYKKDVVLTTNVENGWLRYVPYLMIGKTGRLISTALRDGGARTAFTEMETEGAQTLYRENEARKHINRVYQMAGPVTGQGQPGLLPPGVNPAEIDTGH